MWLGVAYLYVFIKNPTCETYKFVIGWKVGFSAGAVWTKGGLAFGRKGGWYWVKSDSILGECWDGFRSYVQWKKWESRDGFKMLGVSDFNNL